jgi:CRP/FNR family cyclic AMP-dependent transcriptional regulator
MHDVRKQQHSQQEPRARATERRSADAKTEMVHVLDEDPELGRDLSATAVVAASAAAIAPLRRLARGIQPLLIDERATHGHFGLLLLDGLIARRVTFDHIGSTELVGPGDFIHPWRMPENVEREAVRWDVLTPTRLAVLDRAFAIRVAPWPELTAALMDRRVDQAYSQLVLSALRQAKRVDERLLLALWHFALRWGRVGPEGRIVHLPNVTAEILAQIVGARRQSVSTSLAKLRRDGTVQRRPDGSWLIPNEPPQLEHRQPRTTPTDEPFATGIAD